MVPPDTATEGIPPDEARQLDEASAASNGENQPPKKPNIRKRTKTGCFTCRRRRIKCDEGKPTCNNCIKSKRHCDGYNPRLTFKEPIGTFHQGNLFGHPVYHQPAPETASGPQLLPSQTRATTSQGPLPTIAPRPPMADFQTGSHHFGQLHPSQPGPSDPVPPAGLNSSRLSLGDDIFLGTFPPAHLLPPAPGLQPDGDEFFPNLPPDILQGPDIFSEHISFSEPLPDHVSREDPGRSQLGRVLTRGGEYWHSDDEASMADSEDDDGFSNDELKHLNPNELGVQIARNVDGPLDFYGTRLRTFSGFLDTGSILATYTPSSTNSPLNDSQTASVFWYFVNVTGPSMSLFGRNPIDPSPIFQGMPVSKARQHIWTYTFPIMSFSHPALLQAILALGSLQMAKLQGMPATASMKHYHLSLRRIAKNYQSNRRRTQPATLAATLLLGFYEIWNSDHDKWCKHMWGARAILKEIPLRTMTQAVLQLKMEQNRKQQEYLAVQDADGYLPQIGDGELDMTAVDTDLVSRITGRNVNYQDYSDQRGDRRERPTPSYTERDVENYENLSDLFWWYCKMDVYQSILGGTRLFLEYDLWTQCAPRGPIGRIDAVFGTYDHIMLLLGRLASFASLDLARKRKARKADSSVKKSGQSPPMFPGLLPSKDRVTVPTGFSPPRDPSPQSDEPEDVDIDESTAAAHREWEAIQQAFNIFRANLGPDFDPMGPEIGPPQQTPFGPALMYRTYSIAGVWMSYYMGLIVLHRAHPSMPPVAMIAAGMAAQHTGQYANEIGRIAAGLAEDCDRMTEVSTSLGSAFIESCFCVFVAGVQYRDSAQRHWTIKRLHDVARLTGWQSARQIADGCEAAWTKAAQVGRGPPYHRAPELELSVPPSVWTNPRRIDRRIGELDKDEGRYVLLSKSERAHYALGLLSVDQDFERLDLQEDES